MDKLQRWRYDSGSMREAPTLPRRATQMGSRRTACISGFREIPRASVCDVSLHRGEGILAGVLPLIPEIVMTPVPLHPVLFFKILFIWLCRVSVAATCRLSCSIVCGILVP